ncbi:hypothetical protein HAT86_11195 [Roseovarius gahaiensis]|uniref:PH domain-containing protein n=1 Tax=Roseovarius gahaiensis TaxID=2716691 RepID=A0A967BEG1_9RHOB|nr:hypothetical protein [Roseovarius gahaiensis]NHQ75025.1 hypothetical protein [Roseovarius gahaiensis]
MKDEVLAIVAASPPRRVIGVGSVLVLGVTAICVALLRPPSNPGWVVFLLALGLGALWLTDRMRRATGNRLELTRDALRSSTGEVLVNVADVEAIERGAFAFKPSNGFTLVLKRDAKTGPKRWEPGLWWRLGRRLGVGGVTPGHQAKAMAEILSAVMQERQ